MDYSVRFVIISILCFLFLPILEPALGSDDVRCAPIHLDGIPKQYGTVDTIIESDASAPWVILIRDSHHHFLAQRNTALMLSYLHENGMVDSVLTEGAAGSEDVTLFTQYPDRRASLSVTDYLLNNLYINGAEYFVATTGEPIPLIGIEQPEVYASNLLSLEQAMQYREETDAFYELIGQIIHNAKNTYLSPALLDYERYRATYRAGSMQLNDYIVHINNYMSDSAELYPTIQALIACERLMKNIDFTVLAQEEHRSLALLKKSLPPTEYDHLQQSRIAFYTGTNSAYEFYLALFDALENRVKNSAAYPNLTTYCDVLAQQSELSLYAVQEEIKAIEQSFLEAHITTPQEKSIYELEALYESTRTFFSLGMTSSEWERFNTEKASPVEQIVDFVTMLDSEAANNMHHSIVSLQQAYSAVRDFYRIAKERDHILARNALRQIEEHNFSHPVIFAGGFHTDGLIEELSQNAINIAIVTPRFSVNSNTNLNANIATFSNISMRNALQHYIATLINAIAVPRWLAQRPVGIAESNANSKLIESAVLIMTAHAENLLKQKPDIVSQTVLNAVNDALTSVGSVALEGVRLKNIKRFANYREYEVSINDESLFFYFASNNTELTWDSIREDMQHILLNQTELPGLDAIAASTAPIHLHATQRHDTDVSDVNEFIAWVRRFADQPTEDDAIRLAAPLPATLAVSRDQNDIVISLIALTTLPGERSIVYQDRIPVWRITPHYLVSQVEAVRKLYGTAYAISPDTLVIDIGSGYIEYVEYTVPDELAQTSQQLFEQLSEEDSFSDFPFEEFDDEIYNDTETQIREKLLRNINRMKSFELVIQLAQFSNNKLLLTIISSDSFYDELKKLATVTTGEQLIGTDHYFPPIDKDYPLIIRNLITNRSTPSGALLNIVQKSNLLPILFSRDVFPSHEANGLNLILNHPAINAQLLDNLADRLIELEQRFPLKHRIAKMINAILPIYRIFNFNDEITTVIVKAIGLPPFVRSYLMMSHARQAQFAIIAHPQVDTSTIRKLYTSKKRAITRAIARSYHPEIVADVTSRRIRKLVIANPNTPLTTLMEYMTEDNSPAIRSEIAHHLSQHPHLTDTEIEHLMHIHDFDIQTNLLLSLFTQTVPDDNTQQYVQAIIERINELIPSMEQRNRNASIQKIRRFATALLAAHTTDEYVNRMVTDELVVLACRYPDTAYAIMSSDNAVNPMITDLLIGEYSQDTSFNLDILAAAAQRPELSAAGTVQLAAMNDRAILRGLLLNHRIAPIENEEDIVNFHDHYLPLIVSEPLLLSLLEENLGDISFMLALAAKPWLPPTVLLALDRENNLKVYAELASSRQITPGVAAIIESKKNILLDAVLLMNPAITSNIVHRISVDAVQKFRHQLIFKDMSSDDIQYYTTKFPFLKEDSTLTDYLYQNTHILTAAGMIELGLQSAFTGSLASLSSKMAIELLQKSRAGNTADTYMRVSPFLFSGIYLSEFDDETTPAQIDAHLPQAQLKRTHADLVPVGTLFLLANALYLYIEDIRDTHPVRAEHLTRLMYQMYRYSVSNKNNPHAQLALHYLETQRPIPETLLYMHPQAQVLTLDLHNAQPFDTYGLNELDRYHRHDWQSFSYEQRLVYVMAAHILRDTVRRGILTSTNALILLNQLMSEPFSRKTWHDRRKQLLADTVIAADLTVEIKDDLLEQPMDSIEFFLRHGPRGVLQYGRYQSFVDNLILDNAPPALHDDIARSVWFELMDVTESQLFMEPHYLSHIRLIRSNGESISESDSIQISFPVFDDLSIQAIDTTIRAEIGHVMDAALFRRNMTHDTYYPALGEFQDRATMLYLPKELDNPATGEEMVRQYKQHDDLLIKLFLAYQEIAHKEGRNVIRKIHDTLSLTTDRNMCEWFLLNNMRSLFDDGDQPVVEPHEQLLIGELLYRTLQNQRKTPIDDTLKPIIEQITAAKQNIEQLPWNVRAFFEGGTYLSTYGSAYPQILPPSQSILGRNAVSELALLPRHIAAEWLSYIFRMRIRELLYTGELTAAALPHFYRTAIYYLNTQVYNQQKVTGYAQLTYNAIKTISPQKLFGALQERTITGSVLTRSQSRAPQKRQIAEPEKVMLKSFCRLIDLMYRDGVISFGQMVPLGSFFMNKVYPQLADDPYISVHQDPLQSSPARDIFAHTIYAALGYVFHSVDDVMSMLANLTEQNATEPQSAVHSQRLIDIIIANEQQHASTSILETSPVIIDFDALFGSPHEPITRKKLFAFGALFSHAIQDMTPDARMRIASNIIFLSHTHTQQEITESLADANFLQGMFNVIGSDAPNLSEHGITQYLQDNHGISIHNTILLTGYSSSLLKNTFLDANGIVIQPDTSADLFETGAYISLTLDLLLDNIITNGTTVGTMSDSAIERLGIEPEAHIIPAQELLAIASTARGIGQTQHHPAVLPIDALAGVTLVMPTSHMAPQARRANLQLRHVMLDQSL